jgi:elongation factor Ts
MSKTSLESIQKLRKITGLGMLDCKKALDGTGGDIEKAVVELRKKGAALANKRADKDTAEGIVVPYIHPGSQAGVLIELNCETDFVARTEGVMQFAKDVAMHIAAMKPLYLNPEEVEQSFLDKEREIAREQLLNEGKPEAMIDKILEGKMKRIYSEICLLQQKFIKDDKMSISDKLEELIAQTGEKIQIKRFAHFEIGA